MLRFDRPLMTTTTDAFLKLSIQHTHAIVDRLDRGVRRLYEGDPAPVSPFADLLDIHTGEPLGESGIGPWLRSKSIPSDDYLVVISDPRPKSLELRNAMRRLSNGGSGVGSEVLKRCVIVNSDTPAENRRFVKKTFGEGGSGDDGDGSRGKLMVLCDENMEWMREYTALGEKVCGLTRLDDVCCIG